MDGYSDRIWLVIDMGDPEHPFEAGRFALDTPEPPVVVPMLPRRHVA